MEAKKSGIQQWHPLYINNGEYVLHCEHCYRRIHPSSTYSQRFIVVYIQFWVLFQPPKLQIQGVGSMFTDDINEGNYMFDSSIRKWTSFESIEPFMNVAVGCQNLISIGHSCYTYETSRLIGFDMVRDEIETIPAPPEFRRKFQEVAVLEWEGCASLAYVRHDLELRLWVLREDKKWEKVFTANLGELGLEKREDLHPCPKVLVGMDILMVLGDEIVSYGIESGRLNAFLSCEEGLCGGDYFSYKPTLFSWDYCKKAKGNKGGKKRSFAQIENEQVHNVDLGVDLCKQFDLEKAGRS
ncbi:uncharacterized protein LOC110008561 [Amborella trichopoda]|uniref:uncharacterized protein LOC110008561 n=1 Tax=Amborella trichopoda TaxID=13333 RepID=UPI0009BF2DB3|nr:uncharacterized protein LOC110008561 [Amborella trichopoda]XP_020532262.1 uncharacterized protein LOC110008561 [Amborella trichopoda]XP_020532263.1 uncharacterized protein LOC110008561 [Amborella trichopoda]|eukprot:XP_020532261.1 uncharacterized protein LOC110008561 [Amborella trichopoda]